MHRRFVAGGIAAALLILGLAAWAVFSPGYAISRLDESAAEALGRRFTAGGAELDFFPLAIRMEEATLSGPAETSDNLVTARSLVVPLQFGQLLSRNPDFSSMRLREAEFALLIDERGVASWAFPEARADSPLRLILEQSTFRYFDARNGQGMALRNVDGVLDISADGAVAFNGSAVVNARVVRIDLTLKSLARVNKGGSPLELAVVAEAGSASFSGRLDTSKVLSLAGPVSLTSADPAELLRWAGIPLEEGTTVPRPLNADGALDSIGRAHALRNAAVTLGALRAAGEAVIDLRGERPKLQANMQADRVWLDAMVPAAGAANGEWGRRPLPFALLRSFDAEVSLLAAALHYGNLSAGASRIAATLSEGKLEASGAARLENGGTVSFIAGADAVVLPPVARLTVKAEGADMAELLPALGGKGFLAGTGTLSAELSAQGQTQEELVGTLKGTAGLAVAEGRIAGTDLPGLLGAMRSRILEGWMAAPGGTPFTSLSADVSLADGVASIRQLLLQLSSETLSVSGSADLLRRAVDLRATVEPATASPLPVPAVIRGPWNEPRLYPDVPDILNNPEGGFARLRDLSAPPGN
ncbi:AsmA family protein [Aestuariivirga sp.]|uniref:AsmA family protein n=1 Tax=Aestuariivirga sp. TaxID=2650926 RepID=UPI00391909E0